MLLFQIVLPVFAPLIDLFALYGLVFGDTAQTLAVWGAFNLTQLMLGLYALRLDREPLRPLWLLPLQQFAYRQLMYLVNIESTVSAFKGVRSGWRHLPRVGDVAIGAD